MNIRLIVAAALLFGICGAGYSQAGQTEAAGDVQGITGTPESTEPQQTAKPEDSVPGHKGKLLYESREARMKREAQEKDRPAKRAAAVKAVKAKKHVRRAVKSAKKTKIKKAAAAKATARPADTSEIEGEGIQPSADSNEMTQ